MPLENNFIIRKKQRESGHNKKFRQSQQRPHLGDKKLMYSHRYNIQMMCSWIFEYSGFRVNTPEEITKTLGDPRGPESNDKFHKHLKMTVN